MDLIVNIEVAAVNNVVYNLATCLFKAEGPARLALVPVSKARLADVIPLLNLGLLISTVVLLKLKGKFPGFLSSRFLILVLLSVASLGCFIHPYLINYADAKAHASLTGLVAYLGIDYPELDKPRRKT